MDQNDLAEKAAKATGTPFGRRGGRVKRRAALVGLVLVLLALAVYGATRLAGSGDASNARPAPRPTAPDSAPAQDVVLSAADLKRAALEASDLPAGFSSVQPWSELEMYDLKGAPEAVPASCQPIVDLYSPEPRHARHARVEKTFSDARGDHEFGYRIYLDSYSSADGASAVLDGVREALDVCTSDFRIEGAWKFLPLHRTGEPDSGDEALAFAERGRTEFTVVRVGTVLVFVDSGDHDGSEPGAGKIDPAVVDAQVAKIESVQGRAPASPPVRTSR